MKKPPFLLVLVACGVLLGFQQWRFSRHFAAAAEAREALMEQVKALDERLTTLPAELQAKLDRAQGNLEIAESRINQMTARAAELEQRLQAAQASLPSARPFRTPPRVWPPMPDPAVELAVPTEYVAVFPKRNHWGPEEVTGAPDTDGSGDIVTAWASATPDGGPEWLKLDYDRPVDIGEVRIRETHNPGAISKVTAFQPNGQEIVLWEGQAEPGTAPNDFVVHVTQRVSASQIKVYVDSQRVPGWNEIDAVELVGKDGSRQWAKGAAASSTFAERSTSRRSGLIEFEPVAR